MKENLQDLLIQLIKSSLRASAGDLGKIIPQNLYLDIPAEERFGDLSSNIALQLSKQIKRKPLEIAAELLDHLKKNLETSSAGAYIDQVKVEGAGFINFYLSNKYFYEQLNELLTKGSASLKNNCGRGKKVLVEFVSQIPRGRYPWRMQGRRQWGIAWLIY